MSDTDSPEPESTPAAPAPQPYVQPAPQAGPPPANPFVPRYREPWLNPAKKGAALALGVATAVVLLAIGFLLGLGLGNHRHGPDRHELRVVLRHPGMYGPPHGWAGYRPRGVLPPRHPARPAPRPVPSTSHS